MPKPTVLFDREVEWSELGSFVRDPSAGARLGIMYGRRRQGKTLLLELLAEVTDGFYFTGLQQSSTLNLRRMSREFAAFRDVQAPVQFSSWEQALSALLSIPAAEPYPVILDEFPYLMEKERSLPSLLQALLSPRSSARRSSRARLIVCGSAISVMKGLLSGTAPLRGRAGLEQVVRPFGFREAARFWGLEHDWLTAFRLHALVGGTPAYRDFANGDAPRATGDLDRWVTDHLLNPSSAFFREGRTLLEEEQGISDDALYWSVLTAIAGGNTRRGQIASVIGKAETALSHSLAVLTETEIISRQEDGLRKRRSTYQVSEPILRFHQVVIEPNENRLVRRRARQVWAGCRDTVSSRIYGPHFEHLAREWTREAARDTLGGDVDRVGSSVVECVQCRQSHEIDVVAIGSSGGSSAGVLAIGEAKSRRAPVSVTELQRLRHVGELRHSRLGAGNPRLLLFSRSGFTPAVVAEAGLSNGHIQLIDLDRLYTGD